jgi:hypothetical protein
MVLPLPAFKVAMPSKLDGVGLPSSMISPSREMMRYLKPRGKERSPMSTSGP